MTQRIPNRIVSIQFDQSVSDHPKQCAIILTFLGQSIAAQLPERHKNRLLVELAPTATPSWLDAELQAYTTGIERQDGELHKDVAPADIKAEYGKEWGEIARPAGLHVVSRETMSRETM